MCRGRFHCRGGLLGYSGEAVRARQLGLSCHAIPSHPRREGGLTMFLAAWALYRTALAAVLVTHSLRPQGGH